MYICSSHLNSFLANKYKTPPSPAISTSDRDLCLNVLLTEYGDIHQHERDEDEDDCADTVGPLLEGYPEYVQQLLDVNDGQISLQSTSVGNI